MSLGVLVAILGGYPGEVDIQLYIGQRLVIASSLLVFEIPKGGPKLGVRKKQLLDRFSSSCEATSF